METNNQVIMAEWFNEHWYKINKEKTDHYIASVTTKLSVENKPFLAKWRGDIGNREADLKMYEASERGKRIHFALHIYLLGGVILYNPWNSPNYIDEQIEEMKQKANGLIFVLKEQGEMLDMWKIQRFFEIVKPEIIHSEKIVYSIEDDIAGTLDIALNIKAGKYPVSGSKELVIPETGLYIADLKTGKTVEDSVFRQLAPYCHAYENMGLGQPKGALVIHTGSTNKGGIPGLSVKICMEDELKSYLEDYQHLAIIWKRNNPDAGPNIFKFPTMIKRSLT